MKAHAKNIPDFTASKPERAIIATIAKRAVRLAKKFRISYDMTSAMMDIEACHCNGCALDLERLRDADDGTFGHDVFGIRRFLDRQTGELGGCFLPRTSAGVSFGK